MSSDQAAAAAPGAYPSAPGASGQEASSVTDNSSTNSPAADKAEPRVPHIRIVPHIVDVHNSLYFDVMSRDVPESTVLKVGRFTDKVSQQMSRIAFRSKVVSRSHAEIWTENGQFFIKDTKSSSGTFLNHMRLSPPGVESRPYPLHDGDILQLGVDYQGGKIDIYKCVRIRLEINRNWQWSKENPFRRQVLENIQNAYHSMGTGGSDSTECCICLYQMVAFQALFVAPCSHCFHYKCVKPLLFTSTAFSCPLCRTYADLEASVTIDENEMEVDVKPPILPPAVQNAVQSADMHHHQADIAAVAAAASAEAAVQVAESSAVPIANNSQEQGAEAGVPVERDANSTPVPGEQANVDSFGTTPVGSMPPDMSHLGAIQADADVSLVGAQQRGDFDQAMQIASPALSSDNADANACAQQQQQGSPSQNNSRQTQASGTSDA
ncbi:hypothetical protein GGI25_003040 [Coemansia spiralis]|uniref:SMAD/FHA domain-containing protein n=2 Tax=Coemansia TaxID=4863 RepID=A0A9W8G2T3_9FUNG|nr:hypothetical protein BX070DRAFT_231109 [Coemansia spiralis]KAJ1992134.1 hypothetical protein EDC05_002963 [Coemansia umbellata]KAJ2622046.1 hypothetical protein GGI26_003622 [Coemansia sp. RSA 1358]KAJ2677650.1 hypothetical protein GGI25_003040 [Coemansia spiralis]